MQPERNLDDPTYTVTVVEPPTRPIFETLFGELRDVKQPRDRTAAQQTQDHIFEMCLSRSEAAIEAMEEALQWFSVTNPVSATYRDLPVTMRQFAKEVEALRWAKL